MMSLKWLSSYRDPRPELRDLGLFGITDVPFWFTTCMSDTCVSVLCVRLYLHVSSVDMCVHV